MGLLSRESRAIIKAVTMLSDVWLNDALVVHDQALEAHTSDALWENRRTRTHRSDNM
jgi:hypothetical protein